MTAMGVLVLLPCRHRHPRFINVTLRVTKNGTKTTDLLIIRVYSFFAFVSEEEEEALGNSTVIQCASEHMNLPQLFMGALCLAAGSPSVANNGSILADLPLFPCMSSGKSFKVIFNRRRTSQEINDRLARDLRRIGQDRMDGQRAVCMYGFRRGGAQHLLDVTGKYELVMRLGDWKPDSSSFFVYLTNMNARGTLRSTLRSYAKDDVTQMVAQIMAMHNSWTLDVVRSLRERMTGKAAPMDAAAVVAFDNQAAAKLCWVMIECVLQLRHGRNEAIREADGAHAR